MISKGPHFLEYFSNTGIWVTYTKEFKVEKSKNECL